MNAADQNRSWYLFTQHVIKPQIFLPPDILWVVEIYTGQINREKCTENYCSDITLRSVLASGSDQNKTSMQESLQEGNFCRILPQPLGLNSIPWHLCLMWFLPGHMGQTLIFNQESWSPGGISSPAPGGKSKPQFLCVTEELR